MLPLIAALALEQSLSGNSPSDVFDDAVDAAYLDFGVGDACGRDCKQEVIASKTLGDTDVELRKSTTIFGDAYAIVYGKGGAWHAATPIIDIDADDCAMGKCVKENITKVAMDERDGVAWVTISVASTIEYHHDHPHTGSSDHQIVFGCKLDSSACVRVDGGSRWEDGSVAIGHDKLVVTDHEGHHTVNVRW